MTPPEDRLDSWKEIAAHLKRDVTIVSTFCSPRLCLFQRSRRARPNPDGMPVPARITPSVCQLFPFHISVEYHRSAGCVRSVRVYSRGAAGGSSDRGTPLRGRDGSQSGGRVRASPTVERKTTIGIDVCRVSKQQIMAANPRRHHRLSGASTVSVLLDHASSG
jgi:hypothetical protein